MRRAIPLVLAVPFAILAADPVAARQMPDMAALQQAMEEMQRCMADVDQGALQRMAEETQAFTDELRSLCAAGRRDRAQEQALAYALRMRDDPDLRKMRTCSERMREAMEGTPMMGMMPAPPDLDYPTQDEIETRHVCDGF
jgi:hypothetical protein